MNRNRRFKDQAGKAAKAAAAARRRRSQTRRPSLAGKLKGLGVRGSGRKRQSGLHQPAASAPHTLGLAEAYKAGQADAVLVFAAAKEQSRAGEDSGEASSQPVQHFRQQLHRWFSERYPVAGKRPAFQHVLALGVAYREGYALKAFASPQDLGLPVPLSGRASVVVTACNEEKSIGRLLDELNKLPLLERIVVLNGCSDNTFAEVKSRGGVLLAHFPQRLGHDVGRSIGASLASGDAVLFVDGDMAVPAAELAAFLYEQENGTDVVLNDITRDLPPFGKQDEVTRCKQFLNLALGRPDLGSSSLTAVPHVLSRTAIDTIGRAALAVPPKAQALAILKGLKVSAPCYTDVISRNRLRSSNTGAGNHVARLIIGDHAEAIGEALSRTGPRLFWNSAPRASVAKARNRG